MSYQLAQVNIGRLRAPLDSPQLAAFVNGARPGECGRGARARIRLAAADRRGQRHVDPGVRVGRGGQRRRHHQHVGVGQRPVARRLRVLRRAPAAAAAAARVLPADGRGLYRDVVDSGRDRCRRPRTPRPGCGTCAPMARRPTRSRSGSISPRQPGEAGPRRPRPRLAGPSGCARPEVGGRSCMGSVWLEPGIWRTPPDRASTETCRSMTSGLAWTRARQVSAPPPAALRAQRRAGLRPAGQRCSRASRRPSR